MTDWFPKERRGSERAPEVLRTDTAPRTHTAPEDRQGPGGQTGARRKRQGPGEQTGAPRTGRGPEDRQGHEDRQGL